MKKRFRRDVGERITRQDAMKTLKPQQRYVLNKLQRYYEEVDNLETKSDIESVKEVFGFPLSNIILQHLGKLRRGGIEGDHHRATWRIARVFQWKWKEIGSRRRENENSIV